MDSLSFEILSLIIDDLEVRTSPGYLPVSPELARFSTISRAWQFGIETYTFKEITVGNDDVPEFARIYSSSRRRRANLRKIHCKIKAPKTGNNKIDRATNQLTFRKLITSLLCEIGKWDDPLDGPLSFDFVVTSASDDKSSGPAQWPFDPADPTLDRNFLLLGEEELKRFPSAIRRITSFASKANCAYPPHPSAFWQIANIFTHLETIHMEYWEACLRRHDLRMEHRTAIAKGLRSLCGRLPCLSKLSLHSNNYHADGVPNHNFEYKSLLNDQGVDELCEAIRLLAQHTVTDLKLAHFEISRDLFFDRLSEPSHVSQTWQKLQTFDIMTTQSVLSSHSVTVAHLREQETQENLHPVTHR